ncbi:MAG: SusF/SusE family outer membrane protein [Candidatus Symbiothrix sp.]|jgi:hypothetical protein|nr:SusF/SusE family outer membrane protein [Candidatus Symbiothrix sp.]
MKNIIKNIILLFAFMPVFMACENDEEKMYVIPTDKVTAATLSLEGTDQIVVTEATYTWTSTILKWTPVNFGTDVLVQYSLELSNGEKTFTEILGNGVFAKALVGNEISKWVIDNFNGINDKDEPQKVNLSLRIAASPALENPNVTNPVGIVYSNALAISVVPHFIAPEFPDEVYMIGEGVSGGGWDWAANGFALTPVHSNPGHFWCVRYLEAGKGFKWNTKPEWGGDFWNLGTNLGFTEDGGNAVVAQSGMYMIYVDWGAKTISVETAKVSGMGDAFGGDWTAGNHLFEVVGKTMQITTMAAGELRICATSNISDADWWKMEFVPINGIIEYRGTGPDQERVAVSAGKVVTLDFNAGTATIK